MKKLSFSLPPLLPSLFLSIFLVTSCGHFSSKEKVEIGNSLKAHQYKKIYFSGQPSDEDFKELKKQGFTHIVNLRRETEYSERDEKKLIKTLGMNYSHHPFPLDLKVNDDYVDGVTASVVKHRKEGKTLVHCSSGNRVAIWLGAHFKKDHGQSSKEAFDTATDLGLEKEGAKKALKEFLGIKE
jgi:protein tyrosine phosphatase (PTP) superfamily phosphohydrolase (DUF442 family)